MKYNFTYFFLLPVLLLFMGTSILAQQDKVEKLPVIKDEVRKHQVEINLPAERQSEVIKQQEVRQPALATDILINNNTGASGTSGFTQSETSILGYNNTVLIGFNDAGSYTGGTTHFTGFSYSTDGGATFTDGGVLPVSAVGDAGDPAIARDETTGRIYFTTLGFTGAGTIQVFKSDDNGITWSAPVNGTPGGSDEDKQWVAVDNFSGTGNGNVYVISRRFGTPSGIYVFRSTDHGGTFIPSGGVQIVGGNQGAYVTVGPDHAVYAFWYGGTTILMRKSTDFGATFGPTVTVYSGLIGGTNGDLGLTGIRQGTSTASAFRSSQFPHAAVNPVSGHIYCTFDNKGTTPDKANILYVMSTDGGATWSAAVKVNDDVTTTDQWQPTIAVSPNGANIGFFYYSRQEDNANNLFKYYGRTGIISGSSVVLYPSFAISDVASLPEFGRDAVVNSVYMGDYNFAHATNSKFYVTWSDNRDDLAGGAPRKDPNVYFEALTIGPPCPVGLAGNPSPANGVTGQPIFGNSLSWTNGAGATAVEVWFGEYGNAVQVYNGAPISSFSLAPYEPLDYSTQYQWRIVGKNDTCNVSGSSWNFTSMPDPNIVIDSLFCENFESGLGGWTIVNNGGTSGCVWMTRTAPFPNTYTLPPAASGAIMTADVDECGSGSTMNTTATLIQSFNFSSYTSAWIEFDNDWNVIDAQDEAHVEVSTDGGTTWVGVWDKIGTDISSTHEVVDISSVAAGKPNVTFRLRSVQPGWDWWWVLDNFCLYGQYIQATTFQLSVNVANGWNMLAIPGLLPTNQNVGTWWPGRDVSASVFKYLPGPGYTAVTSAIPGEGYWMKNTGAQIYNTGDEWPSQGINIVSHTPINAASGWNLFGGYDQSVPVGAITTTPPGLISGSIYKYNAGYEAATSVDPGFGYWVKLTGAGQINIPSVFNPQARYADKTPKDFGKITITDNLQNSTTLYSATGNSDLSQYELPPLPPLGMFDVRFTTQKSAERLSSTPKAVEMMGIEFPVKIKADGVAIILSDESGRELARLNSGEEFILKSLTGNLLITESVIPLVFSLDQNYPNPFNPSTTIRFSIPEDVQNAKLLVYNALGEKVSELVNSELKAGVYEYNWNAGNEASGIYFYQITAGKYTDTKKMMLIK